MQLDVNSPRSARGLRCACGRRAVHSMRVDGAATDQAEAMVVPVCWACGQLALGGHEAPDGELLCDFYHTTWLKYDFEPDRQQGNGQARV